MKEPPAGMPMTQKRPDLDRKDREILKQLADEKHCQQRIITDGGHHYIYCGAYYEGHARKTSVGYRCKFHSPIRRKRKPCQPRKKRQH
jgi:hypothetical protein